MLGDLKLLQMAGALARHSAARHELLARNIANADTNGYRAKDLERFEEIIARTTSGLGPSEGAPPLDWRILDIAAPGLQSPNGNTVSLEDQMVRSVEAQQSHEAATAIYKKTIDILKLSLGRGA